MNEVTSPASPRPCWMQTGTTALGLAALIFLSGCYDHYRLRPDELKKLDGVERNPDKEGVRVVASSEDAPVRELIDERGEAIEYSTDRPLTLIKRDGHSISTDYRSIHVDDAQFVGVPATPYPLQQIPLAALDHAEVPQLNRARSVLAGTGFAVLGGFALLGALALFLKVVLPYIPGPRSD